MTLIHSGAQTTVINQAQYKHITDIHKHTDLSLIKNAK